MTVSVTGEDLYHDREYDLRLRLVAGAKGLRKKVKVAQIQKLGLAFAGHTRFVQRLRVQVIGKTELSYLETLPAEKKDKIIRKICSLRTACFVVTRDLEVPLLLIRESEKNRIPLFKTELGTLDFIERVESFLEDKLAATTTIHGVLVDVFGVGVLIVGKSGIGKSECALDLVLQGHRFVADDMVFVSRRPPQQIVGCGADKGKYHMEIRGLGIIDVARLFGVEAVREEKYVQMVIELVEWRGSMEYDRLGIDEESYLVLGKRIPKVKVPVTPGRNLAAIIGVAARNHLLKMRGYHSAKEFEKRLIARMSRHRTKRTVQDEIE